MLSKEGEVVFLSPAEGEGKVKVLVMIREKHQRVDTAIMKNLGMGLSGKRRASNPAIEGWRA